MKDAKIVSRLTSRRGLAFLQATKAVSQAATNGIVAIDISADGKHFASLGACKSSYDSSPAHAFDPFYALRLILTQPSLPPQRLRT